MTTTLPILAHENLPCPNEVLGTMKDECIEVTNGLEHILQKEIYQRLVLAYEQGYDFCVVTTEGAFATKKI